MTMNTNFKTMMFRSLSVLTAVCAVAAAAQADCRNAARQTQFLCTPETVFNPDAGSADSSSQQSRADSIIFHQMSK